MSVQTEQSTNLRLRCKACGYRFQVAARFAGKVGVCPNPECGCRFRVPALVAGPSPCSKIHRLRDRAVHQRPTAAACNRWLTRRYSALALSVVCLLAAVVIVGAVPGRQGAKGPSANAGELSAKEQEAPKHSLADARKQAKRLARDGFAQHVPAFLKAHCVDCHSGDAPEADLDLERLTVFEQAFGDRPTWEKVARMLELRNMPPPEMEQPSETSLGHVLAWIDRTFFEVDCNLIRDPGRVTIRRLNRAEYNNTIRDLVGVDFYPADDFPSDDVGDGFDNMGDVLTVPPLLLEKYLAAAEKITEQAIVVGDPSERAIQRYVGGDLKSSNGSGPREGGFITLASTGEVFGEFKFPRPGEYMLRAEASADQAGPEPAKMEFRIAGRKLEVHDIEDRRRPRVYETKFEVGDEIDTGTHRVEAAFINDYYQPRAKSRRDRGDRNLHVRSLEVQGPLGDVDYPETHKRIVVASRGDESSIEKSAREILRQFARRAFRRPVADHELEPIVALVDRVVEDGEPFERGVQFGIQAVLVSPHFLFRVEGDPAPDDPNRAHDIGQFELASRLSYFLWSSMPDKELFQLAEQKRLDDPQVLEAQVRRMLADSKSQALVDNFASQWLNLRLLDEMTPNAETFPAYSDELKRDMRRETELFFETVMREDRSVLDFLDGDFTFVNERLANHYGIDGVEGEEFRKVSLDGLPRAGVLTQASILTLTSDPNRTLPVKRGKWILENILGTPPPPPPADVPDLEETQKANPDLSLREQLKLHREDPTCASCHKIMDPIGLGFENFDAIGRWRDEDNGHEIDAAGTLPDGGSFQGPVELIRLLKSRQSDYSRQLTTSMLTYALGRGLEHYDRCAVDRITEALAAGEHRFSTLVTEIVTSDPFLMRRGDGGQK